MDFKFFFNYHAQSLKYQALDLLILNVQEFFDAIQNGRISNDDSYIFMRWNSGYEKWTASKYNKHRALKFLEAYIFINCLLSKNTKEIHHKNGFEDRNISSFRCKFWKSHISEHHVRWVCLHKYWAELEEPFELWNLDFISGKERKQTPHKIHHKMLLLVKPDENSGWQITGKIMSQEDFMKDDIKCLHCK